VTLLAFSLCRDCRGADAPTPEAVASLKRASGRLLVEKCYSCHGEKLSSRGCGWIRARHAEGSEKGSVIEPPRRTRAAHRRIHTRAPLRCAVRQAADAVIADFTAWAKLGAPWPVTAAGARQ